jgi:hypothetical protein
MSNFWLLKMYCIGSLMVILTDRRLMVLWDSVKMYFKGTGRAPLGES